MMSCEKMSGIEERPKKKRPILRSLRCCLMCGKKTELIAIRKISFPSGVHGNLLRYKCPDCFREFSVTRRLDTLPSVEDVEIVRG